MRSERGGLALRIGFSAATTVLVMVGASLNAGGRTGWVTALAGIAGLGAFAAGVAYRTWRVAVPLGTASMVFTLLIAQFNPMQGDLLMQLGGLILLGIAGIVGGVAYRSFMDVIRRQLREVQELHGRLEMKHRAFLAATSDVEHGTNPGDMASLTASIAGPLGADFACCYLASPDHRQFLPQPPGVGLDRLHPQPVSRGAGAGRLVAAIDSGKPFDGEGRDGMHELFGYLPEDLRVKGVMAVPMPIADRVGGFMLLGSRSKHFTEDDRRLATTLTLRAGAQLASAHAVALSIKESARYTLMNELVKEASGRSTEEVLELVIGRGREVIRYEAGRAAMFHPDGTYVILGSGAEPAPIDGPLAKVRSGETVLRNLIDEGDRILCGLKPASATGVIHEALTPIRGKDGVVGALCLGRNGTSGFSQGDVGALDELGSMAGVAVENSRILQAVSGQASRLDTALDALGEVSQALTTVTQGSRVLEQKTLETAVRVTMGTAGLLTRATPEGRQAVIMSLGFPAEVDGMEFHNGQGIVGAVMLNLRPTAVSDVSASFDLASPPDLAAYGLQAALCTPMLEEGQLWGTLSVFDAKKRDWTPDDQRVLATLGNQGVVAVRNAELYDNNQRSIWELRSLQEALQAATSTLDLGEVMQQVLAGAAKASSAQIGCLALEDGGRLVLKGGFGTDHVTAERLALGLGGGICARVMETGEAVMEALPAGAATESPLNPRAVLCVPITLRGKPLGVVFLANYKLGETFTEDHRNLVTELATQAAVAIQNARLFQDREEVILDSLAALANAVDARDPYTAGHSERVTRYALMIARQMRFSPEDQAAWTRLERGGRLHDIGKIGVPDAILQKTGRLTDDEFAKMRSHTTVGFNILSGLRMLTDELVIVRSHHERYDGRGYPDRKAGADLPLFAWIVSAADAIDAMTSDRPYRKGMSIQVAVDEVRSGAGKQFHPDVAEAVLDAVANGTLKLIPQESLYKDAPRVGAFENLT